MAEKKLEGAGLRGQVAGQTALSTVGKEGKGLTYRGYAIEELSEKASFEEVAYMLLYGNLPNQSELSNYKKKLKKFNKEKPKILIVGTRKNKNIKNILISLIDINCELIIIGSLNEERISSLDVTTYINDNGLSEQFLEDPDSVKRQYISDFVGN